MLEQIRPAVTEASTAATGLMPLVTIDKPNLPAVQRPVNDVYASSLKATLTTRTELQRLSAYAGPNARPTGAMRLIDHQSLVDNSTFVAGCGIAVGLIGALLSGGGHGVDMPVLIGSGALAAGSAAAMGSIKGAVKLFKAQLEHRRERRLTTAEVASVTRSLEALPASERAAVAPVITVALNAQQNALSAKAYSSLNALVHPNETPGPVETRAGELAGLVVQILEGRDDATTLDALESLIENASPDERRSIAATMESGLFRNEQEVVRLVQRDAVYALIATAAAGKSPLG